MIPDTISITGEMAGSIRSHHTSETPKDRRMTDCEPFVLKPEKGTRAVDLQWKAIV